VIQKVCADNGYYKCLMVESRKYLPSVETVSQGLVPMRATNAFRHDVGEGKSNGRQNIFRFATSEAMKQHRSVVALCD